MKSIFKEAQANIYHPKAECFTLMRVKLRWNENPKADEEGG